MTKIIFVQILMGLLSAALAWTLQGVPAAFSAGAGALIIGFSLAFSAWAWGRIFRQKTIALSIGVIVFKYAALIIILYKLVNHPKILGGWLAVGISSLLPTSIIAAWILSHEDRNRGLK